jgi:uncharacterized protein (DUF305 family)
MSWKTAIGAIAAAAAIVVAIVLIAGGGDDTADAAETDDDFIAQMTVHHQSAIEMAEMARERGEHPQIKQLADAIVQAQADEIDEMEASHERLFGEGVQGHEHGDLGLSEDEMGAHADMAELESAEPFDQAFIDMMIPHHQGAIRMARVELENGEDGEIAAIAEAIIEAQSREIEQMNRWRKQWYGAISPAGGVPAPTEEAPSHEEMGH